MLQHITLPMRKVTLLSAAAVLLLVSVVPALIPSLVSAAPTVTERELQSTSAIAGGATDLTWIFDTPNTAATNLTKVEIEFCDSPLSACTAVNGTDNTTVAADNIPIIPASPTATLTGPWSSTPNTATRVAGDAGGTTNQIDISLTTPGDNDNLDELHIAVAGFTNDEETNASYYTRMRMYDGATLIYEGVSAQSTSQTLTVSARVQERLDFCVGSTTVDDATTTVGTACANITGTTVDIGNVESGQVNVSPVNTSNGGNDTNGVAMVRTNAVNGVVVDYKAIQNTSSGTLKVPGAACSGPTSTGDQCFNVPDGNGVTAGTPPAVLVAGAESFGMTIAGVNCGSNTAYPAACVFATGLYNLVRDAEYDGDGSNTYPVTENDQPVGGTTTYQYAWLDSGVAERIASSAGSTVKVVDDEALILKFAATAGVTTPTGSYSVQADYIATATF